MFIQPLPVGLVDLFYVFLVPGGKKLEDGAEVDGLLAIDVLQGRVEA